MLLGCQRNGITGDLRGEMRAQEKRLGMRIDEDKKTLAEITERLEQLETRQLAETAHPTSTGEVESPDAEGADRL